MVYSLQHWGFVVFTERWGLHQEIRLQYQWTEERRLIAPGSAIQKQLFTQFCLQDLLLYRVSWPDCHGPITAKRGRASATTLYTSTQGCKKIGVPVHSHLGNGLFWRWCDSHLGIKPFIDWAICSIPSACAGHAHAERGITIMYVSW